MTGDSYPVHKRGLRVVWRFKIGLVTILICHISERFQCFLSGVFHGDSSWSVDSVTDLVLLNNKIKIPEKSKEHMNNVMSLSGERKYTN